MALLQPPVSPALGRYRYYYLLSDASGILMSLTYCSRLADKCQEGLVFDPLLERFIVL
mgnify:FL=1